MEVVDVGGGTVVVVVVATVEVGVPRTMGWVTGVDLDVDVVPPQAAAPRAIRTVTERSGTRHDRAPRRKWDWLDRHHRSPLPTRTGAE